MACFAIFHNVVLIGKVGESDHEGNTNILEDWTKLMKPMIN